MAQVTENTMAGTRPRCPNLVKHYKLPEREKMKFLETPEALHLFNGLPKEISKMLLDGFLRGAFSEDIPGWDKVINYFMANSRIIPALAENPGTFSMLEKIYGFEPVTGVIDNYFIRCKAGIALYSRYEAVTLRASEDIKQLIAERGRCLMIDIGSGPGRNGIDICQRHPELNGTIKIDCIDIDPQAIAKGESLVIELGIKQVEFIPTSMTKLQARYRGSVDYGLLIGILCGLTRPERIALLSVLRHYFRKGGRLVAASLLEQMAEDDLLCGYILRETTGWGLQYPRLGELKEVFEEAGWIWGGSFLEQPTRFYEIGVGIVP